MRRLRLRQRRRHGECACVSMCARPNSMHACTRSLSCVLPTAMSVARACRAAAMYARKRFEVLCGSSSADAKATGSFREAVTSMQVSSRGRGRGGTAACTAAVQVPALAALHTSLRGPSPPCHTTLHAATYSCAVHGSLCTSPRASLSRWRATAPSKAACGAGPSIRV